MFKIRKNVIREKINIKNSVLDYIRHKRLNWYGHVQGMDRERLPRRILEWCPPGIGKTSEFLDAGGYNMNERAWNWRLGIGRQRGVEKEN